MDTHIMTLGPTHSSKDARIGGSPRQLPRTTLLAALVFLAFPGTHAAAQSWPAVVGWGDNSSGQCNIPAPPTGLHYVQASAGAYHGLALLSDGSVVAWGYNGYGECVVPTLSPGLTYVEVAAGSFYSLARRSDGTAVGWGFNGYGQCNVPALPPGLTYVELAAGGGENPNEPAHSLARRSDGTAVGWGYNSHGQCNVPALPPGLTYVELAAGLLHSLARLSDGSIVAWGFNGYGECNVPPLPSFLAYDEVDAGKFFSLARITGGSVVAWGYNAYGQCNVPALPTGVDYVGISAGGAYHCLAVCSDGSSVAWGTNTAGQCNVAPLPLAGAYAEVSAGGRFSLAMIGPHPCGGILAYCNPAAPNSSSPTGAQFEAQGCASHVSNSLVLQVHDLPPSSLGIFYYGPQQTKVPFGNGWVCVAGPVSRVLPATPATSTGTVTYAVDLTQPPFSAGGGTILPGSNWNFQYWYRDPTAPPKGYNLSNAVQVLFAP